MIDIDQRTMCVKLYRQGKVSIKEIMERTGIRSEQTVYRILDSEGIPRQRRDAVHKSSITFDEETWQVIRRMKPRNLSKFVCEAIKKAHTRKKD